VVSITSSDRSDYELRDFVIAALGAEVFMVVFFLECTIYDLSTAMFFAFGLGFLARGHFRLFFMLFPIAALNRETAFLLTAFFAVFYFSRTPALHYLAGIEYQCLAFGLTRWAVTTIYADNPGEPFYFWPARVLYDYENQLIATILLIVVCAVIAYFVARRWDRKPLFLRYAVLVLFPLLLVMHLTMGMAFEIRVFAEVFPVVWVLYWI
jgi:hypothetical protein